MFTPLIVVAVAAAAIYILWRLSKRSKSTSEQTPVTPVEQPVETAPVAAQLLPPETITYSYDNTGRLTGASFSNGQGVVWEYDEVGNRDRIVIS